MNVIDKAKRDGLLLNKPMTAKALRRSNPRLASRWAKFIEQNKVELVKAIASRL